MPLLADILYALALPVAAPLLALKSLRTGKYRSGWPARFGFGDDVFPDRGPDQKLLLLHCVSVGELLSVQTLLHKLLAADHHLLIALTTTTDTGTARALSLYANHPRIRSVRFPIDFSFAVESLFDRVRPDAIALVELETWPNFIAIAHSRRIPVVLLNGRLSEKSFPRYRLIRPLMASMLRHLTFLGIQTQTIADRFLALGAEKEKNEILPTLKYDNAHLADTMPGQQELAAAMGLTSEHTLFVAGSTAPGEDAPLLDAYLALQKSHPTLRLAIAPRKPQSLPPLLQALAERSLTPILRTDRPDPVPHSEFRTQNSEFPPSSVFILNTLGELKKLYALAAFVFVGRSLVNLGGSDMIEAAALAKPCCFGPYTSNFAEVVELLIKEKAAIVVHNGTDLSRTLADWLATPADAQSMGKHARRIIEQQRGSTDRYVQKLLTLLHPTPPRSRQPPTISAAAK
jgi:3-deoxy-D-manno-octulosonic-acid transferase